jgi:hypothetical protein
MTLRCLGRAVAPIALAIDSPGDDGTQAQEAVDPKALYQQVQQLHPVSMYCEAKIAAQALAVAERKFGPEHPIVANALNNLATLYFVEGRDTDEARPGLVTKNERS